MGNLRQKYTDEEWEELGKLVKQNPNMGNGFDGFFNTTFDEIEKLVKTTPNDQELGFKIRSLINS